MTIFYLFVSFFCRNLPAWSEIEATATTFDRIVTGESVDDFQTVRRF